MLLFIVQVYGPRDTNHPCHHLVPLAHGHDYYTRTKENSDNVGHSISRTERHNAEIAFLHGTEFFKNFPRSACMRAGDAGHSLRKLFISKGT